MNPKWLLVATFVAGAALSWGVYVPLVHLATKNIGSNLRAFLMVGKSPSLYEPPRAAVNLARLASGES